MGVTARWWRTGGRRLGLGVLAWTLLAAPALAQTGSRANAGALRLSGGLDLPSVYLFRGIVQEREPGLTVTPWADLSWSTRAVRVHLGTWHALLSGSSGLDGPTGRLHYEERFSAGAAVPLPGGVLVDATYTGYSSPGAMFEGRHELAVRIDPRRWFNTYALVAFELDGAADGADRGTGTYVELGATPDVPLGLWHGRLAVPVRLGVSAKDYYQRFGRDDRAFGFFSTGALVTIPLGQGGPTGSWDLHGGIDLYLLGDTPRSMNRGERQQAVGHVGLSLRY